MLNIALPKGRLGDSVYELLDKLGYDCPEINKQTRKLVFENKEKDSLNHLYPENLLSLLFLSLTQG